MSLPGSTLARSAVAALPRPLLAMVTDRRLYRASAASDDGGRARCSSRPPRRRRAPASISCRFGSGGSTIARCWQLAVSVRDAIAATGARLLVNDRIDVALAARADGVHLPGRAVSSAAVRAIVPDGFLVGRSVHSAAEAIEAARDGGCDYLVFGSVFESASKPAGHAVAGLDALARVCAVRPAAGSGDWRHHHGARARGRAGRRRRASLR